MEIRITIGNKTWIVPADTVSSLVSWLNSNAIDTGVQRQEIREIRIDNNIDPRQLIME